MKKKATHLYVSAFFACSLGFLTCLLAFYPGFMTADSVSALSQARSSLFTDWHPPMMSWLWGVLDSWLPGPLGMLLLHHLVFWAALFILVTNFNKSWKSCFWILAIGFFPTIFGLLGMIWKDVGMGIAFLMSFALIFKSDIAYSHSALLCSVPFLFYGLATRHNALPAALPLAIWTGLIFYRNFFQRNRSSIPQGPSKLLWLGWGAGLVYLALLAVGVSVLNGRLVKGQALYPIQQIWNYDLAGISVAEDMPLFPKEYLVNPSFSFTQIKESYSSENPYGVKGIPPVTNRVELMTLGRVWAQMTLLHLPAYWMHRWHCFKELLGIGRERSCGPYSLNITPNNLGIKFQPSLASTMSQTYLDFFAPSFLFRGWFWLILSVFLVSYSLWKKLWRTPQSAILIISSSGLLYLAFEFFFIPTCDFRFLWWTALSSMIGFLLLFNKISPEDSQKVG